MDQIEMAVDAGHPFFAKQHMCCPSTLARGINDSRIVTRTTGHAVLAAHLVAYEMRKLDSARLPDSGVAIVVRILRDHVFDAFDDVGVGFNEPVCCWDVAIATTWNDTSGIATVGGLFEFRVLRQTGHDMTRRAEGVRRGISIDLNRADNGARTYHGCRCCRRNYCQPSLPRHRDLSMRN